MSGYISKDYIHYGCGLPLNPELVWEKINYSVKKNIKKCMRNNIEIHKVEGNYQDISILKQMWYDPEDPNIPSKLTKNDFMAIAYLNKQAIGAIIMIPVGNHYFLNNLAGNEEGKKNGVQDYLLWYAVNELKNKEYKYIDVGVSYRQSLYTFFKKWQIISYPVIFNKPNNLSPINLKPFKNYISKNNIDKNLTVALLGQIIENKKFTFVPNIEIAKIILKTNQLEYEDITFNLTNKIYDKYYIIDLTQIFSVQFGALIINITIDDKTMWNQYSSLDVFKRELVYTAIYDELKNIKNIINIRQTNYNILKEYFAIEEIEPIQKSEKIKSTFEFRHHLNQKYSQKLTEFGIEHKYEEANQHIELPCHQNLTEYEITLIYAVFRGVLNLCSEWIHTDLYKKIK